MNEPRDHLNPDAIYAGLCVIRDFAESGHGKDELREAFERPGPRERLNHISYDGAKVVLIPRLDLDEDQLDEIYPGEPESVGYGVHLAPVLIWGPQCVIDQFITGTDPSAIAVRRWCADRAQ